MPELPKIHARRPKPGRAGVEEVDLEFSNGATRTFDRIGNGDVGSVIIVAMPDDETLFLTREYAAGRHSYELGFARGRIDPGESVLEAAQRELKEEAGYGAKSLTVLRHLSLSPAYMSHRSAILLAQDLYECRLPGDEPEPIEVVPWSLDNLKELLQRDDFSEGRCVAALLLVLQHLGRI